MTVQSTPSDLAAWVLDHGVGLTPARQKQLAKGYRRLEAQSDIRGRAVVMYRERAREALAQLDAAEQRIRDLTQDVQDERGACLDQMEQVQIRDARIKAVRELHSESRIIPGTPVFGCAECGEPNETEPCATIRALEG